MSHNYRNPDLNHKINTLQDQIRKLNFTLIFFNIAPLEPGGFEHAFLSANGAMSLAWGKPWVLISIV